MADRTAGIHMNEEITSLSTHVYNVDSWGMKTKGFDRRYYYTPTVNLYGEVGE